MCSSHSVEKWDSTVFVDQSGDCLIYVFVQRSNDGMTYYSFEFLAKASNFTRHGLGTVAIKDGTTSFYSRVVTRISDLLKV